MQSISTNRTAGFTIVELLVVMSVLGILMSLVIYTLGSFYQSNIDSLGQTVQSTDTRSVLRTVESELVNSSGFLTTNNVPIVAPLGVNNSATPWQHTGNDGTKPNNRVLIAKVYLTDKAASDASRTLIYTNTGICAPTTGPPAVANLVYFAQKDASTNQYNLYRRTILPTGNLCATPFRKQSCASSQVALYSSICKASDAVLLYDIDTFGVDYYSDSDSATPMTGDISGAKTTEISVTTKRLIGGVQSPYTTKMRISHQN